MYLAVVKDIDNINEALLDTFDIREEGGEHQYRLYIRNVVFYFNKVVREDRTYYKVASVVDNKVIVQYDYDDFSVAEAEFKKLALSTLKGLLQEVVKQGAS